MSALGDSISSDDKASAPNKIDINNYANLKITPLLILISLFTILSTS